MRQMLSVLGITGLFGLGAIFLGFIIIYIFQNFHGMNMRLKQVFYFYGFESFMVVSSFYFYVNMHLLLMIPSSTRVIQNVTLAIELVYMRNFYSE